jgi:hypothetical protein
LAWDGMDRCKESLDMKLNVLNVKVRIDPEEIFLIFKWRREERLGCVVLLFLSGYGHWH